MQVLTQVATKLQPQQQTTDTITKRGSGEAHQAAWQQQSCGGVAAPPGAPLHGNIDLGAGVRVVVEARQQATKPNGNTLHALWVYCYDAHLERSRSFYVRHRFLLCDDGSFQPRQPRRMIGSKMLCETAGYTRSHTDIIKLAQTWTSAPGGPTLAEGATLDDVRVFAIN
jgi:hypothetical protein